MRSERAAVTTPVLRQRGDLQLLLRAPARDQGRPRGQRRPAGPRAVRRHAGAGDRPAAGGRAGAALRRARARAGRGARLRRWAAAGRRWPRRWGCWRSRCSRSASPTACSTWRSTWRGWRWSGASGGGCSARCTPRSPSGRWRAREAVRWRPRPASSRRRTWRWWRWSRWRRARGRARARADRAGGCRAGPPSRARRWRCSALGAAAFCVLLAEGSVTDWSAVFLSDEAGAAEAVAALGLAVFSLVMAVGRLGGDGLAERFGARTVVRCGGAAGRGRAGAGAGDRRAGARASSASASWARGCRPRSR